MVRLPKQTKGPNHHAHSPSCQLPENFGRGFCLYADAAVILQLVGIGRRMGAHPGASAHGHRRFGGHWIGRQAPSRSVPPLLFPRQLESGRDRLLLAAPYRAMGRPRTFARGCRRYAGAEKRPSHLWPRNPPGRRPFHPPLSSLVVRPTASQENRARARDDRYPLPVGIRSPYRALLPTKRTATIPSPTVCQSA